MPSGAAHRLGSVHPVNKHSLQAISGAPGELIDRLAWVLRQLSPSELSKAAFVLQTHLAGKLATIHLGGEATARPGSIGSVLQQGQQAVDGESMIRAISARLGEFVALGMSEAFLVKAVTDELLRHFTGSTDPRVAENRAWMVERAEEKLADPSLPADERKTWQAIRDRMQPPPADKVASEITEQAAWTTLVDQALPAGIMTEWAVAQTRGGS